MEYQFTCPECSNFIINHDTEETPQRLFRVRTVRRLLLMKIIRPKRYIHLPNGKCGSYVQEF